MDGSLMALSEEERQALADQIGARVLGQAGRDTMGVTNPAREAAGLALLDEPPEIEPEAPPSAADIGARVMRSVRPEVQGATDAARVAGGLAPMGGAPNPSPNPQPPAPNLATARAAPAQALSRPAPTQAAPQRPVPSPMAMTASPEIIADGAQDRRLDMATEQAARERRRQRILMGVGGILSAFGLSPVGAALGAGAGMVSTEGREREAELRQQIAQRLEARQRQQHTEREQLLAAIEARQEQANRDRDFGLRQQTAQATIADRRAAMEQRGAQFDRTQGFREGQADLDRNAAERRARIIAGQRMAPRAAPRPGVPGGGGGDVDLDQYRDAPIIRSIIETRPEYADTARRIASQMRERGEEANEEDIVWQLASGSFSRLPRDEQDRIRRAFMQAPSSTTASLQPEREAARTNQSVRQYGADLRDTQAFSTQVQRAAQAIEGASDEEIAAAQLWLQGGAARQGISTALAPRAQQLGRLMSVVQNTVLKERSGAAVTASEFQRLRDELGTNWWSSPEATRAALAEMRGAASAMQDAIGASYGPDVVDRYQENLSAVRERSSGGGQYRAGQTVTIRGRRVTLTEGQAAYLNERGGQ